VIPPPNAALEPFYSNLILKFFIDSFLNLPKKKLFNMLYGIAALPASLFKMPIIKSISNPEI
jgi:hypothetical protein